MLYLDDDQDIQDPTQKAVPSDVSDHDERDEDLATEKHWDEETPADAAAVASQRLSEFQKDDVPLSDEDWEAEERRDDTLPDHIDAAVDASLEEMVESELAIEEKGEEI